MKTQYRDVNMRHERMSRLILINKIIEEYQKAGYVLTLRQLYYQLVSRSVIANRVQEYNNLSTLLTEGRMAGLVDWDAIEDRLRKPSSPASFKSHREHVAELCLRISCWIRLLSGSNQWSKNCKNHRR